MNWKEIGISIVIVVVVVSLILVSSGINIFDKYHKLFLSFAIGFLPISFFTFQANSKLKKEADLPAWGFLFVVVMITSVVAVFALPIILLLMMALESVLPVSYLYEHGFYNFQ